MSNGERISERQQNVAVFTKQCINVAVFTKQWIDVSTKYEVNTICAHNQQNSSRHSAGPKLKYKLQ
jgi:hypothetical protein